MAATQPSTLTVSPAETRVCPDASAELTVRIDGHNLNALQVFARARDGQSVPRSIRVEVTGSLREAVEATVEVAPAQVGDDYTIDVFCARRGGEVLAVATATVRVRNDIHLVPSSLELDPRSLSGKITVENCSNVTPEVNFRLACEEGRLTFQASATAEVCAFGRKVYDLQIADRSIELGSCRLEVVDDQGNVLDRTEVRSQSQAAFAPPPPPPAWPKKLLGLLVALVPVGALLIWWVTTNDDDSEPPLGPTSFEFSVDIDGDGIVQVTLPGEGPTEVDGGATFELDDEESTITLLAEPAEGWQFDGWSDGSEEPFIEVTVDDSGITAEFSEVEVDTGPLPDLDLQLDESESFLDISLDGSEDGCDVSVVVRNLGGDFDGNFEVLVVVNGIDENFEGSETVDSLAGGDEREVSVFVPDANFCEFNPDSSGSVLVDSADDVEESDEDNNSGEWLIIG